MMIWECKHSDEARDNRSDETGSRSERLERGNLLLLKRANALFTIETIDTQRRPNILERTNADEHAKSGPQ